MESISKVLAMSFGGYSLEHILSAVITLLLCLLAVRLIMRAVEKLMWRIKQPNERLSRITVNFIKALLYLLTAIITAGALGLNTSSITAIASVLTLGLTLATQDIMSNVAGGLVILSTHPFSIGDVIESDGTVGTVRDISLNHTRIETADGQIILLPNRSLSGSKIINYTTLGRRRIVLTIGASYDAPTETVKSACLDAVSSTGGILGEPAPDVLLSAYGDSAIEYTVRCWASAADYWDARNSLNEALRESFAKYGVEIPYNHLNVHILDRA